MASGISIVGGIMLGLLSLWLYRNKPHAMVGVSVTLQVGQAVLWDLWHTVRRDMLVAGSLIDHLETASGVSLGPCCSKFEIATRKIRNLSNQHVVLQVPP